MITFLGATQPNEVDTSTSEGGNQGLFVEEWDTSGHLQTVTGI